VAVRTIRLPRSTSRTWAAAPVEPAFPPGATWSRPLVG
jgi:hypothetical protein